MLTNEYENQFANETEEERKRRLQQQSGETLAQPTAAEGQQTTSTVPTSTPTANVRPAAGTTTPTPTVAAPPPVTAPSPTVYGGTPGEAQQWGTAPTWQTADRSNLNQMVRVEDGSASGRLVPLGEALQMNGVSGVYNGDQGYFMGPQDLVAQQMAGMSTAFKNGNPYVNPDGTQGTPLAGTSPGEDYQFAKNLPTAGSQVFSISGWPQSTSDQQLAAMQQGAGMPKPPASGPAFGSMAGSSMAGLAPNGAQTYRGVSSASPTAQTAASSTGYNASSFGPGSDLRSSQITPEDSADQATFRQQRMAAANNLANGDTRSQIAQQRLAAFDEAAQPAIRDGIRSVGQQASKFGRLGMGETEVETLRPYTDYLTQRSALAKNLAADTAEGEIGDRFNTLGAFRSLFGDEEGTNAARRGEVRGERDWQQTLAQLAFENAFRTRGLENSEEQQAFNQALGLANVGYGNNPFGAMLTGASQYGQNAGQSWDALAQLLAPYLSGGN